MYGVLGVARGESSTRQTHACCWWWGYRGFADWWIDRIFWVFLGVSAGSSTFWICEAREKSEMGIFVRTHTVYK